MGLGKYKYVESFLDTSDLPRTVCIVHVCAYHCWLSQHETEVTIRDLGLSFNDVFHILRFFLVEQRVSLHHMFNVRTRLTRSRSSTYTTTLINSVDQSFPSMHVSK